MFRHRLFKAGLLAAAMAFAGVMFNVPSAAVAYQPTTTPKPTAKPPTKAEAESWLTKINGGLKTGCSVVKASGAAATLAALKVKNPKMTALAAALTAAGAACDETTKLIDKIAGNTDEKAKEKAAKEAASKLEQLTNQVKLLDEVKTRTKEVQEIDLGVVDATLKQYSLSVNDLVADKQASIDKLKALAAALKLNVERLQERQKFLASLIKGVDSLTPKIEAFKKRVEGFKKDDKGVCDTIECLQNLKLEELLKALPDLKKAAEAKLKEVDKVLTTESERRQQLRDNLKDLFDVKVD